MNISTFIFDMEDLLWGYVGVPVVLLLGLLLSFQSNFAQMRTLPQAFRTFLSCFRKGNKDEKGVHPLKAFFACIGGSVGVGNVVGVTTAVQIGGPGALFWIWITALAGAIVKYSEVYLGVKYRIANERGEYSGGPMFFLRRAWDRPWVPVLVCLLLCLYGVEIFQFSVVTHSISDNFGWNFYAVVAGMMALVIYAGLGGVRRVGNIASALIPIFVFGYVGMGLWVLIANVEHLSGVLSTVMTAAFNGHAAVGGFIGSTLLSSASQGIRRGCYTGDIGIGYASVIHSESSTTIPEKQASLVIFEIFLDTFFICTTSVLIILATGVWQSTLPASMLVQTALGNYFPYMHYFMPVFLFLVGYATINAYFCVGLKCAQFLLPRRGRLLYTGYAIAVLILFSFCDTLLAQSVMAIAGGLLLVVNCLGIYRLRKEISFDYVEHTAMAPALELAKE
jgi:AGCS family alanine or glycine:cation symporter